MKKKIKEKVYKVTQKKKPHYKWLILNWGLPIKREKVERQKDHWWKKGKAVAITILKNPLG